MNPVRFLPILIAVTLATPQGNAQEIKILDVVGNLYSMDVKTAETQFIGSSGLQTHLWSAMAMNSQGKMYGAYGRYFAPYQIYEIDPNTGQATFVVQTNLIGIGGMAFGPNDQLYVINARDAPWIYSPIELHILDLVTGTTNSLGDTGLIRMQGLDFREGVLFGYSHETGLATIDTSTAIGTDVNPSFLGPSGLTSSFCFSQSGALFYVDTFLWMIDPNSGVFAFVDRTSLPSLWAEAEFIEGPNDPFALWVGGETDGPMTVHLSGASPNANIAIAWERGGGVAGPTAIPAGFPCAGTLVDLTSGMQLLTVLTTNASGEASTPPQFVPAGARRTVHLQAIDLSTCETSNRILIAY